MESFIKLYSYKVLKFNLMVCSVKRILHFATLEYLWFLNFLCVFLVWCKSNAFLFCMCIPPTWIFLSTKIATDVNTNSTSLFCQHQFVSEERIQRVENLYKKKPSNETKAHTTFNFMRGILLIHFLIVFLFQRWTYVLNDLSWLT